MLVQAEYIEEASLRDPLPLYVRPYGAVFLSLYAWLGKKYVEDYDTFFVSSEWTLLFFGGAISLQLLFWLLPFWNINLRELFETKAASDPATAQLIKLVPSAGNGTAEFVPITSAPDGTRTFVFQQRRFLWDSKISKFCPPQFAVDSSSPTVGDILNSKGLSGNLDSLKNEFGANIFDIPIPTFLGLWKEHAVAPFFVFQIFSCCLWFLDEMWKSSVFMLIMLIVYESTTVLQRQRTMTEFRGMSIKPYQIYVYRNKEWIEVSTTELLPGDLVSVQRSAEGSGLACDLVLLEGTCVVNEAMLSGESTPLLKEGISARDSKSNLDLEGIDRISLLAGGTNVIQVGSGNGQITGVSTPDGGALAYVARTGFETTQGQLVRTMIFSAERVGSGSKEAYFFILFLLVFALAASYYVWKQGELMGRKQHKVLLDCVLIITSVVPPELPMELTMAVNSSLTALSKYYIYCTEPFRIPFAGRIDVCCFDKTGTLTEEDLLVQGADLCDGKGLRPLNLLSESDVVISIASAHALVKLDDGEVVGDPMEKNTVSSLGWTVDANDIVKQDSGVTIEHGDSLKILKRFPFSSALKRSSTLVKIGKQQVVAVKGAPETVLKMLKSSEYTHDDIERFTDAFTQYTRNGMRVLAYASKSVNVKSVISYKREDAECDLVFAGFVVYTSPLKPDAISAITMLNESSHRTIMITGDNPLTAVKVAEDVGILEREALILDVNEDGELIWASKNSSYTVPYSEASVELYEKYDLCMTGSALGKIEHSPVLVQLIRHTWVYARVSPTQKEFIIKTYKDEGYMTLMCGDGTNDVGALKQAHIGVALLNGTAESMAKIMEKQKMDTMQNVYEKQRKVMEAWGRQPAPVPLPIAHLYPPGANNPNYVKAVEARGVILDEKTKAEIAVMCADTSVQAKTNAAGLADRMTEMVGEGEELDAPQLKLGDASCAAPITSKLRDVDAVVKVIRQGRCALVTTIQMYKILALNCLVSAYTLSVLYLAGIKMGDGQAMASGILLSMCSMSVSRGKVVEKLSKERPQPGIFNKYIMGSILGQFAVHVTALIVVRSWVHEFEPPALTIDVDTDKKFEPSLLNTAMYLLQIVQEISTYAVNYQGRPFRESLTENKGMYYGVVGCMALAFAGATEFLPEMNEALQLVPIPTMFKIKLVAAMLTDLGLCVVIEHGFKYFFSDFKPKNIALKLDERGDSKIQ